MEVEWNIIYGRELISARPAREERAGRDPRVRGAAVDDLLEAGPPEALRKGALDLADVDRGAQRLADVHDHVRAQALPGAG